MTLTPTTFPHARLQLVAASERTHFWHVPRRRLLLDTVAQDNLPPAATVLDVGCGTGAFVEALAQRGLIASGLDPWAAERWPGSERFRSGQAEALPWPDASFRAACAFDVLEHADDAQALRELVRVLEPGGTLFVSVPAHAWLWSTRDDLAGHRRRYTRALLRERATAAGFVVERVFGYQGLLLAAFALSRWAARLRGKESTAGEDAPAPWLNRLLRAVNGFEVAAGRWVRPPTGSSLVLVARKPAEARA